MGVFALAALVGLDLVLGSDVMLVGLYAIAPFVAATTGGPRGTAVVAALAALAAALAGVWDPKYTDADLIAGLAVIVVAGLFAVFAARARSRALRAEFDQHVLADAAEALASAGDYASALEAFSQAIVPRLADWCSVTVPGSDRSLERVATANADPELLEIDRRLREGMTVGSVKIGMAQVLETGQALPAKLGGEDAVWALLKPIRAGNEVIGVLCLINGPERHAFSAEEIALAKELGRRAGTAILHQKLSGERDEIAETLQRELLPPLLPDVSGWSLAAMYRPAGDQNRAGGDFYDVVEGRDGWTVVMGDVEGHGAEAAALTAMVRYTIRAAAMLGGTLIGAFEVLNRELRRRSQPRLCSVVCVTFSFDREVTVVSAGHPLPLLVANGTVRDIGLPGALLGALDEPDWAPVRFAVSNGEELIVYTDGVVEARRDGERFGRERLASLLTRLGPPADTVQKVGEAIDAFVDLIEDDAALLVMRREEGAPAGRVQAGGLASAGSQSERT